MPDYYVLTTAPQREFAAATHLEEAGYKTVIPQYTVKTTCKRTQRVKEKTRPLIPNYLFIAAGDVPWLLLWHSPDIRDILKSDDAPAIINQAAIDIMLETAADIKPEAPVRRPKQRFKNFTPELLKEFLERISGY